MTANNSTIPETMRALELRDYDGRRESLSLVERPVPTPGRNEVLVRVGASPVNPSDVMFLRGLYGQRKRLPVVPGFECGGEVVATGGGLMARLLAGRRVACAAPPNGDGTWAEYIATPAALCIPLRRDVTVEQGAALIVNPLTAWALVGEAARGSHRAIVQSAAASALGKMVERLGRRRGIPVINIVRRREQVELLRDDGARHVLDSTDADFDERLQSLCRELGATLGLDPVAGEMTGRILRAMPKGARVIVYGALSMEACALDPRSLIFERKRVDGFWLSDWLGSRSMLSKLIDTRRVQKFLVDDLKTDVRARLSLEEAAEGLEQYAKEMSRGKLLFVPGLRVAASSSA